MPQRRQRSVSAALAAVIGLAFFAAPAQAASTGGSGGSYDDRTFQSFTASNGQSSQYHVYANGSSAAEPAGLLLQFHGDGAYEFKNPSSSYSLGGSSGIVAKARERDFITVAALSPDKSGSITWWESGSQNADYVRDLLAKIKREYNIDTERIWLVGYSGGAQFITQYFLPKHSSTIDGGGSVVFGGGGVPRVSAQSFAAGMRTDFSMHWYTGQNDNGRYNALGDARNGSSWYTARGFETSLQTPAGVGHSLSGRFGGVVAQQLDRHDDGKSAAPAPAPAPAPKPAPAPAPVPAPAPAPKPAPPAQVEPEKGAQHSATRTSRGMVFEGTVPGEHRVTLRASKKPLTGQVGWYLTSRPDANDRVRITLSKFEAGQTYYWRLEGANGKVLASGELSG